MDSQNSSSKVTLPAHGQQAVQRTSLNNLTQRLNICITGAGGKIAYSFLPMLCAGEVFGPETKLDIRLLTTKNSLAKVQGIVMDLEDSMYPLVEKFHVSDDPINMFKDCDYIIALASHPRVAGMERSDLTKLNAKIFNEHAILINEFAKPTVKVIVVTNPVNTLCRIMIKHAPSIPAENFTGLTRLDANRIVVKLSQLSGAPQSSIKNVIAWGNHSRNTFADVNHGTIDGQPIRKVIQNDEYFEKDLQEYIATRGFDIINLTGVTATISTAIALRDHIKDLYFGTKEGEWTSMSIASDGSYNVPKGMVFSFPVTCGKDGVKIVKNLNINGFAWNRMCLSIDELEKEADLVKEYLGDISKIRSYL